MMKKHKIDFRVYYEDTDAGGVVYYANYLKFAERARTEFFRLLGIIQSELAAKENVLFVVRDVNMDLMAPARLDDVITIETEIEKVTAASIVVNQRILLKSNMLSLSERTKTKGSCDAISRQEMKNSTICQKQLINQINVKIISINKNFKPVKIPKPIREKIT